jgi:large subunit ribosomal protein L9
MDVILLERVPKLGQMGDVVKVKPGFARNFLLPQKKALRATKDNIAYFETQRKTLEATNLDRRTEAEAAAAKMADLKVTLVRQASEALQLYGSVSSRDIADAAIAAGVEIERRQVELDKPIKSLGAHKIKVHLHPEVTVEITALVARSPDEAEFLAKGGMLVAETERAALEAAEAAQRAAAQAAALFEAKSAAEAAPAAEGETPEAEGKAKAEPAADADAEATDKPGKKAGKKADKK